MKNPDSRRKKTDLRSYVLYKKIVQIPKNVPSYELKINYELKKYIKQKIPMENNETVSFNIPIILRLSHHVVL